MGEALNLIGVNWVKQCDQTDRLADQLSGLTSALEHAVIEQTQALNAVSTVKLLDIADTLGKKMYFVTPANVTALLPTLVGTAEGGTNTISPYVAAEITSQTGAGRSILLPEHKNIPVQSYSGNTKLLIQEDAGAGSLSGGYLIGGGLAGGFGTSFAPAPNVSATINLDRKPEVSIAGTPTTTDPVELWKGSFVLGADDISVGSDALPLGLGLHRSYSTALRLANGVLGYGWQHNFGITLNKSSSASQAYGEDSPLDAATMIAGIYALCEVLKVGRTRDRLLVSALAQSWLVDQIKDSVLSMDAPGSTQRIF